MRMRKTRVVNAMVEAAKRYGHLDVVKKKGKAHGDVIIDDGRVVAKLQSTDIEDLRHCGFIREKSRTQDGRVRTYESTPFLTSIAKREEL